MTLFQLLCARCGIGFKKADLRLHCSSPTCPWTLCNNCRDMVSNGPLGPVEKGK